MLNPKKKKDDPRHGPFTKTITQMEIPKRIKKKPVVKSKPKVIEDYTSTSLINSDGPTAMRSGGKVPAYKKGGPVKNFSKPVSFDMSKGGKVSLTKKSMGGKMKKGC